MASHEQMQTAELNKQLANQQIFEDVNNSIFAKTFKLFGYDNKKYRHATKGLKAYLDDESKDREIVLKVRHLDVTYGSSLHKFKAIKDVSFNIYKGEILGLVGESGSGKSTIGNTIAGLVNRSFGDIELIGRHVPKKHSSAKRSMSEFLMNKVQMIFQDPSGSLNPHKNIWNVVKEGLDNLKHQRSLYLKLHIESVLKILDSKLVQAKLVLPKSWNRKQLLNRNIDGDDNLLDYLKSGFMEELKQVNPSRTKTLAQFQNYLDSANRKTNHLLTVKSLDKPKKQWVIDTLKSVGLDTSVLDRYPLEFSGGQQQRIGISRALVMRPTLLVADEPISALDVSIQAQVINIFNDLKEKYDLTMMLIAHDLRMVEYVSDRIAVMYKGRIVEIGKAEDIARRSYHPYTKSLLDAVPSLESKQGSLVGYVYDPEMHPYNQQIQPEWLKVREGHYILATAEELADWKQGKY
ncbi:ABC transporter ATP-binding protein [Mycoplasmopsis agassizii]|uniref:ABC transporter ATP-binding protein n=1 Tax=Mycoplasmopsis agassizii TaxID=33922 RepID=UPI0035279F20